MFYDQFIKLCHEKGVKPSIVAEAIGLNRSAATGWKRGCAPTDVTIEKLCEYFEVDRSVLLPGTETLQTLRDDERALLHSYRGMTDEQKHMMGVFIRGLKQDD